MKKSELKELVQEVLQEQKAVLQPALNKASLDLQKAMKNKTVKSMLDPGTTRLIEKAIGMLNKARVAAPKDL